MNFTRLPRLSSSLRTVVGSKSSSMGPYLGTHLLVGTWYGTWDGRFQDVAFAQSPRAVGSNGDNPYSQAAGCPAMETHDSLYAYLWVAFSYFAPAG